MRDYRTTGLLDGGRLSSRASSPDEIEDETAYPECVDMPCRGAP